IGNFGSITLNQSAVSDNRAALGGGIFASGNVKLVASTVSGNSSFTGPGGGIVSEGMLRIQDSTIAYNDSVASGGGVWSSKKLTVQSSTIAHNRSKTAGGGIWNGGTLAINNSSVSGNTTLSGDGGGIAHGVGALTVHNSTVAYNHAGVNGGGISMNFGTVLLMANTIVAKNGAAIGPDFLGILSASGHNLFSNSSGGTGYVSTDLLNVDPKLGPLTDNGGPTLTHALLPGSPALDAGDNADAPEWDQRGPGYPRIVNG